MQRSVRLLSWLPVMSAILMLAGFSAQAQDDKPAEFGSAKKKKAGLVAKEDAKADKDKDDDKDDKDKADKDDDERGGFGSTRKSKKDDGDKLSKEEAKRERELAKLKKSVATRMGKKEDVYVVLSTIEITFDKSETPTINQDPANQKDAIIRGGRVIQQGGAGNANQGNQQAQGGFRPVMKREVHLIEGRDAAVDHVVGFLSEHMPDDEPADRRTTRKKRGEQAAQVETAPSPRADWEFHGAYSNTPEGKTQALARQEQIQNSQKLQDRQRRR